MIDVGCPKCGAKLVMRDMVSASVTTGKSCWRCGTWIEEDGDMMCNRKGCDKVAVIRGFCSGHAREEGYGADLQEMHARRSQIRKEKKAVLTPVLTPCDTAEAPPSTPPPAKPYPVEMMAEELSELIRVKLRGAGTLRQLAEMYLAVCLALEEL